MKKYFNYALLSAIAFVGATGFTACSSSDEVAETNPNYNPEKNAVKTEFVINVTQPGERTRMAAADAGAGTFQGITNMNLFCYADAPATVNSMDADHKLTLTSFNNTPAIDGSDETKTNTSSQVYTMYIPVGTANFLFYATALGSITDKFAQGSLGNNLATATTVVTNPAAETDIKFNLESIVPTASSTTITTPQGYLTTILNGIKDAQVTSTNTWAGTHGATGAMTALGNAFDQFTNQAHSGDVRQGSSLAILHMVKDLFGAVNGDYALQTDADAKAMAEAVLDKIVLYFDVTKTGAASPYTYTWNSDAYKATMDGATFNTNSYPESQNLPTGSAVIVYDNTNGFSFINDGTHGAAAVTTAYDKFTYPSQLTYYCNSGLWQTTAGKTSSDYPTSSSAWLSYAWNTNGWNGNAVSAATRAVAMKDNITYGAAQLLSTIKLDTGVGTTENDALVDNASTVTGGAVANNVFDGSSDAKTITLYVHGILIGGQPATSVYDYLPYNNNASDVIYDRFSFDGTVVNTTGVTNYTLAMDNYTTDETQATVNVALEMTANKDFYGISGKIKAGQKFYLIGSLDPANGGTITWDNHKSFKSGDVGYNKNRVFIRDAQTTATFTLKKNTLKNAYSTIPDLRSTQMLFGISVDLAWKTGLTFNVPIGQ